MGFIPRNDSFTCENCGADVPPARGTFRNHCPQCLTAKHVDIIPGDRQENCHGLMDAMAVEGTDPQKLDIVFRCRNCRKTSRNRAATDDSREALFDLIRKRKN